jgi:hypothetical protein
MSCRFKRSMQHPLVSWSYNNFPRETDLLALLAETQARIAFWLILTWWALLALVFNAMRVRAECCVDPLTPPDSPGPSHRNFLRKFFAA